MQMVGHKIENTKQWFDCTVGSSGFAEQIIHRHSDLSGISFFRASTLEKRIQCLVESKQIQCLVESFRRKISGCDHEDDRRAARARSQSQATRAAAIGNCQGCGVCGGGKLGAKYRAGGRGSWAMPCTAVDFGLPPRS
jgi:hypothetical protein